MTTTTQIINDQQLNAIIMVDLNEIINVVAEKLLKKLVDPDGLIETIVYGAGTPSWYERAKGMGGLLGAFDRSDAVRTGNNLTAEVGEHPDYLDSDPDTFFHGSNYWDVMRDITSILTDIIVKGRSGPLFGDGFWTEARDFWQPLLDMLEDGTVDKMFESEFTARNIQFVKI